MKKVRVLIAYFSKVELMLWCASVLSVIISFEVFNGTDHFTLVASLIGVTSIIFNAKGNPLGQFLMIVFSILYGYISYTFSYFGEMVTYLGMTMPMAVFALISWLRHPYDGRRCEVEVNRITKKEAAFMLLLSSVVTFVFYHILAMFGTANIVPSTLSVMTSFIAVYLTFRRSPYFSAAYAVNDIVLIALWSLASHQDIRYLSVVVCFTAFLANDIYAYISWKAMENRQKNSGFMN